MADAPEADYAGKEAVRDPLHDSYGPEVDGRGIEVVRSLPPAEPGPQSSVWRRHRLSILIALAITIVGAVVGGAVGGTVGSPQSGETGSHAASPTTASTSIGSSSPAAGASYPPAMSGTAVPQLMSLPTAIPGSFIDRDRVIEVYIRGRDYQIYRKTYSNGAWDSAFQLVTSDPVLDIVPVKSTLDLLELIVRTSAYEVVPLIASLPSSAGPGATYQFTLPSAWAKGNYATSSVEVVPANDTVAFAFIVGFDGILYHSMWQNASTVSGTIADGWSDWLWFGTDDNATTDWYNYTPTATVSWTYQNDQWQPFWDVFGVRRIDNAVWQRTFRDGYWSPAFVSRGGFCTGRPVVVNVGNGPVFDMLVFVRGGDSRLWYLPFDWATGWSEFKSLGELTFVGEPMVLHNINETQIEVFVCGAADDGIWHRYLNITSGQWSNSWEPLGGDFDSSPKAISTTLGRIDIFAVGREGQMMWKSRNEDSLQWAESWEDLGIAP